MWEIATQKLSVNYAQFTSQENTFAGWQAIYKRSRKGIPAIPYLNWCFYAGLLPRSSSFHSFSFSHQGREKDILTPCTLLSSSNLLHHLFSFSCSSYMFSSTFFHPSFTNSLVFLESKFSYVKTNVESAMQYLDELISCSANIKVFKNHLMVVNRC